MANTDNTRHRAILQKIARKVMREKGLFPEFSPRALAELKYIHGPALKTGKATCDIRNLSWCSIDNDDSLDIDQLTVAEALPGGATRIFVAIADVDALVKKNSAIDNHARHNTTSVYTVGKTFPMLSEKLSNDLTSLGVGADRPAIVIEITIRRDGTLQSSRIYEAIVRNHAKLTYNGVAGWLEGNGPMPPGISAVNGLEGNLRLQDHIAQKMKALRRKYGALDLETIETRPVFEGDVLKGLAAEEKNRAKDIIEDFMIATNGITARFLTSKKFPSVRRVVRIPKRWNMIMELAAGRRFTLPAKPSPKALNRFLLSQKTADPLTFPDLSLSIIKLLGAGEYVIELPGDKTTGHFGLAVRDYAHSTAPNRRFPDLITQRLLKSALTGRPIPYTNNELKALAQHCTYMEDMAKKVERQVEKSAAALLLERRIGHKFDAVVTGMSNKGTWVRLMDPPVEGKLVRGFYGLDVGSRVWVQLMRTDVQRGFINLKKAGKRNERKWRSRKRFRRRR